MPGTLDDYNFVKVSHDGGVTLECWRFYDDESRRELLVEAIWQDETKGFVVRTSVCELPFELWEAFIKEAARWCPLPEGLKPELM